MRDARPDPDIPDPGMPKSGCPTQVDPGLAGGQPHRREEACEKRKHNEPCQRVGHTPEYSYARDYRARLALLPTYF